MCEQTQKFLDAFVMTYKWLREHNLNHYAAAPGKYHTVNDKRQAFATIAVESERDGLTYYIYFQAFYGPNPTGKGKRSFFTSAVLYSWGTGSQVVKQHVDDAYEDMPKFFKSIQEVLLND